MISGGRIVSIEPAQPPPSSARVFEAAGRVVTPPLDAAATQIGLVEVASASDTEAGRHRSFRARGDVLGAHALGIAGKGRNRAHERAFGILHCAQRARLVEMLVGVDQPRDDQPAFDVDAFDAGTRFDRGRNAFDAAALADQEIDRPIMPGDTGAAKEQG